MIHLSDGQLVDLVRSGDRRAFGELYRRHRSVARRMALSLPRRGDPDDLVNEAFEKVFAALRRNNGPTEQFRAYLFVTMRRLALRQVGDSDKPCDELPESLAAVRDDQQDLAERQLVRSAFQALPGRWRAVLWHTVIEERHVGEVGRALGMSANAVSALAYRARERLRQEYLQAHVRTAPRPACHPHRSQLGAYVREGLSRRHRTRVRQHLKGCASCRALADELRDINGLLVRSLLPVFLVDPVGVDHLGAEPSGSVFAEAIGDGAPVDDAALATAMDVPHEIDMAMPDIGIGDGSLGTRTSWFTPAAGGVAASVALTMTLLISLGDEAQLPPGHPGAGAPDVATIAPAHSTRDGESLLNTSETVSQDDRGAEVADGPRTELDESLEVSVATPEVLHDVVPPVETRLGVTLDDGVRVTLDSNLSDMCQASSDGRELVCTVDATLGDFITETVSGTSIDLELEGLGGQIIKAELRDGNLHIDAEHGHLLSSVGALVVGEDGS